ncbi:MAG TPA: hypothetical protein VNK91_05940, partial [Burkholderiaceae bacterium]|nr:hypothetical protein [Burkholderiaceae bacterium]
MARVLLGALLALACVILAASSHLRLAANGLDCEPWPHCYGTEKAAQAANATATAVVLRLSHRVAAAAFALLLAVWAALAWRGLARPERWVAALLIAATALLAWVGTRMPSALPWITLANVLGGFALVALVLALLRVGADDAAAAMTRAQRRAAAAVVTALVLQAAGGVLI